MAIKGSLAQFQQNQQAGDNPYTEVFSGFKDRATATTNYLKNQARLNSPTLSAQEKKYVQDYNSPVSKTAFDKSREIFKKALAGANGPEEQARARALDPFIEKDYNKIRLQQTLQKTGQFAAEITGVPSIIRAGDTFQKQARLGAAVQQAPSEVGAAKAQLKYLATDLKKGDISKDVYQREVKKMQDIISRGQQVVKKAETDVGAKYDPSAGVLAGGELAATVIPGTSGFKKALTAYRGAGERALAVGGVTEAAPVYKATLTPELQSIKGISKDIKEAPIKSLKLGSDTIGDGLDVQQVGKYIEDIKAGKPIAPIIVNKSQAGKLYVSDGAHRLEAAKQLGITDVPIVEKTGKVGAEAVPTKVSGNAERIQSNIQKMAVEKNLTNSFGDLPEYATINMKEQADSAVNLVKGDRQYAVDIIEGKAPAPGNLRPQSVHQALEKVAIDEGNVDLLTKLAKSSVNTELSTSAQNLRIAAERTPNSPVEAIRQVRDARIKAAVGRAKAKSEAELINKTKAQVRAAVKTPTKQDWATFIKSLEC